MKSYKLFYNKIENFKFRNFFCNENRISKFRSLSASRELLFLFIFLFSINSVALNTCSELFPKKTRLERVTIAAFSYLRELIETRGLRILLKPDREPPIRGFKPFLWTYQQTVKKPSKYVTQLIFGRQLVPTMVLTTAISGWLIYPPMDNYMDRQLDQMIEQVENQYDMETALLLKYDYRFVVYKDAVDAKQISEVEAVTLAAKYREILKQYYERFYIRREPFHSENEILNIEDNVLYADLIDYFYASDEVTQPVSHDSNPTFMPTLAFSSRDLNQFQLNMEQKKQLVLLKHKLLLKYAVIDDFIFHPERLENHRDLSDMIRSVEHSEYRQILYERVRSGKLSVEEYHYQVQRDAYMEYAFDMFQVLNILPTDSDGRPFSLVDVRDRSLLLL